MTLLLQGARRRASARGVMGRLIDPSGPTELFLVPPVLHDWYYKGRGMCYPICDVHIKDLLLLFESSINVTLC